MLKFLRKVGRGIKRATLWCLGVARKIAGNPGVQKAAGDYVKKRYGALAGAGAIAALMAIA